MSIIARGRREIEVMEIFFAVAQHGNHNNSDVFHIIALRAEIRLWDVADKARAAIESQIGMADYAI